MAQFNLTAQIQLQAPNNTSQVVQQIQRGLQGVTVPVQIQANQRAMAGANKQISSIGKNANVAGRNMAFFNRNLAEAARRFSVITVATGSFIALARAIKNSVGAAIEFEREMIKISQVTGNTISQLNTLSNEVTRISTNFGVANQSLLETARTLSQAGLSAQKTKQAMQVLANTTLAPTFDDIADTTEGAIAILNQFGREAAKVGQDIKFLENALDSINKVSKNFAVESSDLITAVRRTGGVFQAAGGNLNELIALFTSVRQTTRESAETIATGFRTIFTRLQRTETIDALKELGIQLADAEGKFIGPLKAVEALSIGLAGLDPKDLRFNEIVEQLGGFRQIGKVIPLIKQYSVAQEALSVANSATGDTAKDAILAQQGLGVQFEKVKQQFDKLMRTFADSDTFRGLARTMLDLATAFIKFAESLERVLPQLTAFAALKIGRSLAPGLLALGGRGAGRNMGGRIHGFSGGGWVPGTGSRDTVPAMLTPGEFVIKKSSAAKLGQSTLADMNARGYASGGKVSSFRNSYGPPAPNNPPRAKEIAPGGTTQFATLTDAAGDAKNAVLRSLNEADSLPNNAVDVGGAFLQPTGLVRNLLADVPGADLKNKVKKMIASKFEVKKDRQLVEQTVTKTPDTAFDIPVSVKSGGFGQDDADKFKDEIFRAIGDGAARAVPKGLSGQFKRPKFDQGLRSSNIEQIEGGIFEAFLNGLSDKPFDNTKVNANDNWDFATGIGSLSDIFGFPGNIPADAKRTFSDDAVSSIVKKAATQFQQEKADDIAKDLGLVLKPKLERSTDPRSKINKAEAQREQRAQAGLGLAGKPLNRNRGGSISGSSDTVPALLTPGEFVVKKSAAQSIGYSNLASMNKTGIAKFNKGGAVGGYFARFADGGGVGGSGGSGGGSKSAGGAIASEDALIKNTQALAQARDNVKIVMGESVAIEEGLQQNTNELSIARENVKTSIAEIAAAEEKSQTEATELANKRGTVNTSLDKVLEAENKLKEKTNQLADKRAGVAKAIADAVTAEEDLQAQTTQLGDKRAGIVKAIADTASKETQLQEDTAQLATKRQDITTAISDMAGEEEELQLKTGQLAQSRKGIIESIAKVKEKEEILATETGELSAKRAESTGQLLETFSKEEGLQENTNKLSKRRDQARAIHGEGLGVEEQLQAKSRDLAKRRDQNRAQEGESLQLTEQQQSQTKKLIDRLNRTVVETGELNTATATLEQKMKEAANKLNRTGTAGTGLGAGTTAANSGNQPPVGSPPRAGAQVSADFGSAGFSRTGNVFQKFGGAANQASGALIGLGFVVGTLIQQNEALSEAEKKVEQAYLNTVSVYAGLGAQFISLGAEIVSSIFLMKARKAAELERIAAENAELFTTLQNTGATEVEKEAKIKVTLATLNEAQKKALNTLATEQNTVAMSTSAKAMLGIGIAITAMAVAFVQLTASAAALKAGFDNAIDAANEKADAEIESIGQVGGGANRGAFLQARNDAVLGDLSKKFTTAAEKAALPGAIAGGVAGGAVGAGAGVGLVAGIKAAAVAMAAVPEPTSTVAGGLILATIALGSYIGFTTAAGDIQEKTNQKMLEYQSIITEVQNASEGFAKVTFDSTSRLANFDRDMRLFNDGTLNATEKLDLLATSTGTLVTGYKVAEQQLEEATANRVKAERSLIKEGIVNPVTKGLNVDAGPEAEEKFGILKELRNQEKAAYSDHNKELAKIFAQEAKLRTESTKVSSSLLNNLSKLGRIQDIIDLTGAGMGGSASPQRLGALAQDQFRVGLVNLAKETKKTAEAIEKGRMKQIESIVLRFDSQIKAAEDDKLYGGEVRDPEKIQNLRDQKALELVKIDIDRIKSASDQEVAVLKSIVATKRETLQRLRLRQILERSQTALRTFNDILLNSAAKTARNFEIIGNVIDGVSGAIQINGDALGRDLQNIGSNLLSQTARRGNISVAGGGADFNAAPFQRGLIEAKKIVDAIPGAIEGQQEKIGVSQAANEQNLIKRIEQATGIANITKIPNIGKIIEDEIPRILEDAEGGEIGPEQSKELIDKIQEAIEPNLEVLKRSIEIQNQFLANINKVNGAIVQAQSKFVDAVAGIADIRGRSADRIAEATGRPRSVAERERDRRQAAQIKLRGTGAVAGNVQRTLNAALAQRGRSRDLKQRGQDIAAGRLPGAGGLNQLNQLDLQAQKAADGFKRAKAEIERLADQSALASDIMGKIQEEQKKREQLRSLGQDIAFGSDEQRKEIADQFNTLQQAVGQGGIQGANDKQRAQVLSALDKLPDVIIGNTGKTGKELKAQFQADEILRVTGNRALAQASFDQAMAGSPEEKLLRDLAQVGAQEAEAQKALALIEKEEVNLLRVIAQNTTKGFKTDLAVAQAANVNPAQARNTAAQIGQTSADLNKAEQALPTALQANEKANVFLAKTNEKLIALREKGDKLDQTVEERTAGRVEKAEEERQKDAEKRRKAELAERRRIYMEQANAGMYVKGGLVAYKSDGGSIFQPKGTDTVPAMLTPGEFVIRKSAVDKIGVGALTQLNNGNTSTVYRANGGPVGGPIGGGGGVELPSPGTFQRALVSVLSRRGSKKLVEESLEQAGYADAEKMADAMYALAGRGVIGPNNVRGGDAFDRAVSVLRESPFLVSTKPPGIRRPDTSNVPRNFEGAVQAIGIYKRYADSLNSTAQGLAKAAPDRSIRFASKLLQNAGVTKQDLFGDLSNVGRAYVDRAAKTRELVNKLQKDKVLIDSKRQNLNLINQNLAVTPKNTKQGANLVEMSKNQRKDLQAAENRLMTALFGPGGEIAKDIRGNKFADAFIEKRDLAKKTRGLPKKFQEQLKFLQGTGILRLAQGGGVSGMDSVPAMLTPGEFVMSPEAVKKHGVGYMKSLNRGRVPGFRRGGLVGHGNVAYRANGSNGPETGGGGAILQLDTTNIQSVLNDFNVKFGSHVDNMIANLGSFVFAATGLAESISNGMDLRVIFSGDLQTAVKLDGDQTEHLKNAIADNILPKIEQVVSEKMDTKIQELKDNP